MSLRLPGKFALYLLSMMFAMAMIGAPEAFAEAGDKSSVVAEVKEYQVPTPYSHPFGISVDSKGIVWFTGQVSNRIGRLDPATGTIKEYPVPSARALSTEEWEYSPTERTPPQSPAGSSVGNPLNMVMDAKGRIWFTEELGNKIGMFDPATESFREFDVPSVNSKPTDIVIDQEGIIWFTEWNTSSIGRFDPVDEAFKEYAIRTPNGRPTGITVDKDGNLWYTEESTGKIGVLNPKAMTIKEFKIPFANPQPFDIDIDSAGNVWFTMKGARKLGMFSPSTEKFFEAVVPGMNSVPLGILIDRDDFIWFTDRMEGHIGRFDSYTAAVDVINIPTANSIPVQLALAPDGSVWFTENHRDANNIGRITITKKTVAADKGEEEKKGAQSNNSLIYLTAGIILIGFIAFLAVRRRGKENKK